MDYIINKKLKFGMFNISLASEMGMERSFLLYQIISWLEHNQNNEKNIRDGLVWAYGSYDYWHDKYPYISRRAIETHLLLLVKDGWLVARELSAKEGNRQKWYTAGIKATEFFFNDTPSRKSEDTIPQDPPPIPQKRGYGPVEALSSTCALDINIKTDIKTDIIPPLSPKGEKLSSEALQPEEESPSSPVPPVRIPQGNAAVEGNRSVPSAQEKRKTVVLPTPSQIIGALRLPSWLASDEESMGYLKEWLGYKQSHRNIAYIDLKRALAALQSELDGSVECPDYAKINLKKAYANNWKGQNLIIKDSAFTPGRLMSNSTDIKKEVIQEW